MLAPIIQVESLVVGDTETPHSRRRIELARSTVAALRAHQKQQEWERRVAREAWAERDLVFCTLTGGPFDAGSISHAKDRALDRANLPRVRTHDPRHTAATHLLSQGLHPKVVQELLGHSSITLKMNTYSHVLPSLHEEVAKHMDSLVSRTKADVS